MRLLGIVRSFRRVVMFAALFVGWIGVQGANAQALFPATVPRVVAYSGTVLDDLGQPRNGSATLTFSIYADQASAEALWLEQHDVQLDSQGRFTVLLGSTLPDGLPLDIFSGGNARWLGLQVDNEREGPRGMLLSVPYALKAAEADTLAGYTIDQFVRVPQTHGVNRFSEAGTLASVISPMAVTANYLQKGDGSGGTTDSTIVETGGSVGIGIASPAARLHVLGPDNTIGAYPEMIIADSTAMAANVGGGFGLQGKYTAGGAIATFAAVKGGKETATGGNYQGYLSFWTQPSSLTERMRITSGGNVGIGTTTPQNALHVVGPDNTVAALPGVIVGDSSAMGPNVGGGFGLQGKYTASGLFATLGAVKAGKENGTDGSYTGYLSFWTQGGVLSERFRITSGGNVGIGTTTPSAKLHVAGDMMVDGNIGAKYQDVAEWVEAAEPLEPGTIVVIDGSSRNRVKAAKVSYDSAVAGAVSAQPGLLLGEPGPGKLLIAQSGRVRVKVDARYGAIRAGDLLVTSPRKGYAMRSRPVRAGGAILHRPGTVLGKALEPLARGSGEILVLLTLQ
jgi:hypothetical protein